MKHLLTACTVLAVIPCAFAQLSSSPSPTGLLGTRYVEVNAGWQDQRGLDDSVVLAGAFVNVPIVPCLDVGVGYQHADFNGGFGGVTQFRERMRGDAAGLGLTAYTRWDDVKPFVFLGVQRQWTRTTLSFGGTSVGSFNDQTDYGAISIGAEVVLARVVLTPSFGTSDHHNQNGNDSISTRTWNYAIDAHVWLTPKLGAFVNVSYADPVNRGWVTETWTYTAGLRGRF